MDEQYHETSVPLPGKALPSQSTSQSSHVVTEVRNEDSRQERLCFREGSVDPARDLTHAEDERPSRPRLPYLNELQCFRFNQQEQGNKSSYPVPHLIRGPWGELMTAQEINESSSTADDETPFVVKEFFRNITDKSGVSCPQLPVLDDEVSPSSSSSQQEKVNLLLRSFAWSQDSIDAGRTRVRLSSSNDGIPPPPTDKYRRAESLLASQSDKSENASPTSTWVYWEEKIVDPLDLNSEDEA